LVISFDQMPSTFDQFMLALRNVPVFAASFAQIAVFWYAHHIWSRRFGLDDFKTAFFSLLLIFTTLVYVYPLRVIFSAFMHWLSGGWVPFELGIAAKSELSTLFVIYGIGFMAMSGCIMLLYHHALSLSQSLKLNKEEIFLARWTQQSYLVFTVTGAVSVLVAVALPNHYGVYAGFVYATLAISMPVFHNLKLRQANRHGIFDQTAA